MKIINYFISVKYDMNTNFIAFFIKFNYFKFVVLSYIIFDKVLFIIIYYS